MFCLFSLLSASRGCSRYTREGRTRLIRRWEVRERQGLGAIVEMITDNDVVDVGGPQGMDWNTEAGQPARRGACRGIYVTTAMASTIEACLGGRLSPSGPPSWACGGTQWDEQRPSMASRTRLWTSGIQRPASRLQWARRPRRRRQPRVCAMPGGVQKGRVAAGPAWCQWRRRLVSLCRPFPAAFAVSLVATASGQLAIPAQSKHRHSASRGRGSGMWRR